MVLYPGAIPGSLCEWSPRSYRRTPTLGISGCTTHDGQDISSHAFAMQKSAGTERVDNLMGGMKKERISEKPWPDHGSKGQSVGGH